MRPNCESEHLNREEVQGTREGPDYKALLVALTKRSRKDTSIDPSLLQTLHGILGSMSPENRALFKKYMRSASFNRFLMDLFPSSRVRNSELSSAEKIAGRVLEGVATSLVESSLLANEVALTPDDLEDLRTVLIATGEISRKGHPYPDLIVFEIVRNDHGTRILQPKEAHEFTFDSFNNPRKARQSAYLSSGRYVHDLTTQRTDPWRQFLLEFLREKNPAVPRFLHVPEEPIPIYYGVPDSYRHTLPQGIVGKTYATQVSGRAISQFIKPFTK